MNINRLHKILNLREDEEVIRIIRQYPLTLFWRILLAVLLFIVPFFFMYPLFSRGQWGILIFGAVIMIAFIYALRIFAAWYFNISVITNSRVIDMEQRGFFDKTVSGITYDKVQDISYRQKGLWQTIFKYGSAQLQLTNTNTKIRLNNIHHPEEARELLLELYNNYRPPVEKSERQAIAREEDIWQKVKKFKPEELERLNQKINHKLADREKAFKDLLTED